MAVQKAKGIANNKFTTNFPFHAPVSPYFYYNEFFCVDLIFFSSLFLCEKIGAKKKAKIEVIYTTFATNETMLNNLKTGKTQYDLICPSDYTIQKMINENTFKSVSKDILDQVKGVSSLIKYFVMTYKNPHLEGLSILDTPGFNSNDSEDRDRTIDVINECDALFWVFDVNAGTVNRSSISIIKEKLNKPLYVVINKVDTKSDSEVQKVETLIKQTLSDEGLDVKQFIRFSSKSPLDDMMNPIKEVGRTAVRDTFVENLGDELEACLSAFDDAIQSANQEYIQAEEEGDSIQDRIVSCLEDIGNDCNKAYEMPQFKEGFMFFTDDRYVMPKNKGDKMLSLLEQIATTRVQNLVDVIEANRENAQDIQAKYMNLIERKTGWQKVNDCNEQYKKVIVKINKS